jgi:hypothetical protein
MEPTYNKPPCGLGQGPNIKFPQKLQDIVNFWQCNYGAVKYSIGRAGNLEYEETVKATDSYSVYLFCGWEDTNSDKRKFYETPDLIVKYGNWWKLKGRSDESYRHHVHLFPSKKGKEKEVKEGEFDSWKYSIKDSGSWMASQFYSRDTEKLGEDSYFSKMKQKLEEEIDEIRKLYLKSNDAGDLVKENEKYQLSGNKTETSSISKSALTQEEKYEEEANIETLNPGLYVSNYSEKEEIRKKLEELEIKKNNLGSEISEVVNRRVVEKRESGQEITEEIRIEIEKEVTKELSEKYQEERERVAKLIVSFKVEKRVDNLTKRLSKLEERKEEYEETDETIKKTSYKKFEKEKKDFTRLKFLENKLSLGNVLTKQEEKELRKLSTSIDTDRDSGYLSKIVGYSKSFGAAPGVEVEEKKDPRIIALLLYQKLNCRPVESRYKNPNFDECFPTDPRILALVNYWVRSDVGDADYLYDDKNDYLVYKLYVHGKRREFYVQLYGNRNQEWFILVVANNEPINNLNEKKEHVTERINFANLETKEGNIDYNSISNFVADIKENSMR